MTRAEALAEKRLRAIWSKCYTCGRFVERDGPDAFYWSPEEDALPELCCSAKCAADADRREGGAK